MVIAVLLISGLIVAASGHVSDQRSRTARAQMDVVAQQVAGSLEAGDRLVRMDAENEPDQARLERRLPDDILGSEYTVHVTGSHVRVSSPLSDQDVSVAHQSETAVDSATIHGGGPIRVAYDDASDHLEVSKDG